MVLYSSLICSWGLNDEGIDGFSEVCRSTCDPVVNEELVAGYTHGERGLTFRRSFLENDLFGLDAELELVLHFSL